MKNIKQLSITTLSTLFLGLFVSNITLAALPTSETVTVEKITEINFKDDAQISLDQLIINMNINLDSVKLNAEQMLAEQKPSTNKNTTTTVTTTLVSE